MKPIFYLILVFLSSGSVLSQSIERQVFNSFGTVSQSAGINLAGNGGEPLTQTYFVPGNILSQGFLQPEFKDITLDFSEPGNAGASVQIWPNPTVEGLFVSYKNISFGQGKIMIYDMAGKCLVTEPICTACDQQYVPLPAMADGVYVIRVALSDQVFQDRKFIKVSQ